MKKILNFAHRGFSENYPENTLIAFQAAAAIPGCDGIELDVQLSKDGEMVICHDEKINRTCTTGQKGWVKDYTLAQLKQMDFSYKHPELAGQCAMPTLREYFDFMKKARLQTNIELKTGIFEYDGIEEKVYRLIREYDMQDRIIISSFNHYSVLRMKAICPQIRCGLLSETWILNPGSYVRSSGCEFYHPEHHMVTPVIAQELADHGIGINTWTVNTKEDILRMYELGVTAIISNYPDVVEKVCSS